MTLGDSSTQVDLTALSKAVAALRRALAQPKDEFIRDSAIQRFEFSFELAWKALRRRLQIEGIEGNSPREVLRLGGKHGFLESVETWLSYHHLRNLCSHTYREETAEEVFNRLPEFLNDAEKLQTLLTGN